MTVVLLASDWADNARIQSAANNKPPMRLHEKDHEAVTLLQQALLDSGFDVEDGADGKFGSHTAAAIIEAEKHFGFKADAGVAGREVLGALDLSLRGWDPPAGAHWGGPIAKTIVPTAQRKIGKAIAALNDIHTMLSFGKFDFVTADGVTMTALKTHFKLVPPGGTKLAIEEFIALATIDPLIKNFRGIQRTLANANMIRHTICIGGTPPAESDGLSTAAEAPLGGPISFGPPYSDFKFGDVDVTNIDKTGQNSLAAMLMHEATHVIDNRSGFTPADAANVHISEFTQPYETQIAANARHNPSAYATFAAHIDDQADRPRPLRFGLGAGRPF
jgi:peptidoglycan hydrolase-like protein with peptidoglycan-binding domain